MHRISKSPPPRAQSDPFPKAQSSQREERQHLLKPREAGGSELRRRVTTPNRQNDTVEHVEAPKRHSSPPPVGARNAGRGDYSGRAMANNSGGGSTVFETITRGVKNFFPTPRPAAAKVEAQKRPSSAPPVGAGNAGGGDYSGRAGANNSGGGSTVFETVTSGIKNLLPTPRPAEAADDQAMDLNRWFYVNQSYNKPYPAYLDKNNIEKIFMITFFETEMKSDPGRLLNKIKCMITNLSEPLRDEIMTQIVKHLCTNDYPEGAYKILKHCKDIFSMEFRSQINEEILEKLVNDSTKLLSSIDCIADLLVDEDMRLQPAVWCKTVERLMEELNKYNTKQLCLIIDILIYGCKLNWLKRETLHEYVDKFKKMDTISAKLKIRVLELQYEQVKNLPRTTINLINIHRELRVAVKETFTGIFHTPVNNLEFYNDDIICVAIRILLGLMPRNHSQLLISQINSFANSLVMNNTVGHKDISAPKLKEFIVEELNFVQKNFNCDSIFEDQEEWIRYAKNTLDWATRLVKEPQSNNLDITLIALFIQLYHVVQTMSSEDRESLMVTDKCLEPILIHILSIQKNDFCFADLLSILAHLGVPINSLLYTAAVQALSRNFFKDNYSVNLKELLSLLKTWSKVLPSVATDPIDEFRKYLEKNPITYKYILEKVLVRIYKLGNTPYEFAPLRKEILRQISILLSEIKIFRKLFPDFIDSQVIISPEECDKFTTQLDLYTPLIEFINLLNKNLNPQEFSKCIEEMLEVATTNNNEAYIALLSYLNGNSPESPFPKLITVENVRALIVKYNAEKERNVANYTELTAEKDRNDVTPQSNDEEAQRLTQKNTDLVKQIAVLEEEYSLLEWKGKFWERDGTVIENVEEIRRIVLQERTPS